MINTVLYVALLNLVPGDTSKIEQVTINTKAKQETISSTITLQKKSLVILDIVSDESIKKTPDATVSGVLKRVGGTSIQNDKFVIIRGLSDRYNSLLLNGSIINSTEPDKKSFSFDLVPSNLVGNIIISKTASPDLPGDFSGGVINITTKVPSGKINETSLGLGYGSLSTFNHGWKLKTIYLPTDFLSTKEFRSLPKEVRRSESDKIKSVFKPTQTINIPNLSLKYTLGDRNYITNLTIRKSSNVTTSQRQDYMSGNDLMYKYVDINYSNVINASGIANFKLKSLDFKNTLNYLGESSVVDRRGINYDNQQLITSTSSNHSNKFILMSQLSGKKWGINYNLLYRTQPDYRINPFAKNIDSDGDSTFVWRDSYRFWSKMQEHALGSYYNDTLGRLKYGFYELARFRTFDARVFRYQPGFVLNEITNNTDGYNAYSNLATGYGIYSGKLNKISYSGGVRVENQLFRVSTFDFSGVEQNIDRLYLDVLPSINLVYGKGNKNIRLSASRTVARPEFREVANFAYYDFVRNAQVVGNPKLVKTNIINADLRYEVYPSKKELITVSGFYKHFNNPIEQIVDNGSVPSNLILTLDNTKQAILYGAEFEIRKNIVKNLQFYTNLSYFKSSVTVSSWYRPLQGQSPYIINTGLFYTKDKLSVNFLYNRIGERISAVGFQGYPDIYENARDVIDLTAQYQTKKITIKLAVSDLLGQNSKFYQPNRTLIQTNNETNINLTINYKI